MIETICSESSSRSSRVASRSLMEHICVGCHVWPGAAASLREARWVISDRSGEMRSRLSPLNCSERQSSSLMTAAHSAAAASLGASNTQCFDPTASRNRGALDPLAVAPPAGSAFSSARPLAASSR